MALAGVARQFGSLLRQAGAGRCASSAPSVFDRMVQITVVDVAGRRHQLTALEGQTLVQVLQEHDELLGSDEITESPEGRGEMECVVSVPNEYIDRIPHTPDCQSQLEQIAPNITSNCRLGSRVKLSKAFNDMQVALHTVYPWQTL